MAAMTALVWAASMGPRQPDAEPAQRYGKGERHCAGRLQRQITVQHVQLRHAVGEDGQHVGIELHGSECGHVAAHE